MRPRRTTPLARAFTYEACNAQGLQVSGRIEAQTQQEAYRRLEQQGLIPLNITTRGRAGARGAGSRRRLTTAMRDQAMQELVTLLRAGVPLSSALPALREGHAETPLGPVFDDLHARLRGGSDFAECLAAVDLRLPPDVLQMIRAGEAAGELAEAMGAATERLEYLASTRNELRNALIYPAILVVAGIAAIITIFTVVVPRFANLLTQGGDQIPLISRVVLKSGLWMNQHVTQVGIGVGVVALLLWALLQQASVRRPLIDAVLRAPVIGEWLRQMQMARWTHALGSLLSHRVGLAPALGLSLGAVTIDSLRRRLSHVEREVRAGESLTAALLQQQLIDPMGANLLRVGEHSGRLGEMLMSLTQVYNTATRQRMKRFVLLIEPIAILLIGAAIAVLMVAIMLAITSMNDIVQQ